MGFWSGKRVCVTGGAGFVGSFLTEMLVKEGAVVTVVDAGGWGIWRLRAIRDEIRYVSEDLATAAGAAAATRGQQVVLNLAAKVAGIEYNRRHHAEMFSVNMRIATQTMMAAAENGVDRFLAVSSACIYPSDATVPTPEHEGERGFPEPPNEGYGWAKRMIEKLGRYLESESSMTVAVCRPFNIYGPRDNWEEATSHVIPALVKRAVDGEDPLRVWGTGRQRRTFLHVRDAATGMKLIAEKAPSAEPVNLGSSEEVTIGRLAEMVKQAAGSKAQLEFDTSRPDGYPRRAPDISRLAGLTGWSPRIPLEQGLHEVVEDYLRHSSRR